MAPLVQVTHRKRKTVDQTRKKLCDPGHRFSVHFFNPGHCLCNRATLLFLKPNQGCSVLLAFSLGLWASTIQVE